MPKEIKRDKDRTVGDMAKRTSANYLAECSGPTTAGELHKEALKAALDIRKFEIDLYWKRAAYFWAFIAVAFAGYFAIQKDQSQSTFEATYVLTCIGFVFSLAWYFVNRGSKAWQRNWETHVDLLEDEVMGPLCKTTLGRSSFRFLKLTDGYPFSPSKINLTLGVFVVMVWLVLMVRTLSHICRSNHAQVAIAITMTTITSFTCIALRWALRTTDNGEAHAIEFERRQYDKKTL
jgi:hypothetical protein